MKINQTTNLKRIQLGSPFQGKKAQERRERANASWDMEALKKRLIAKGLKHNPNLGPKGVQVTMMKNTPEGRKKT
jgi:hypothetical protein